MEWIILIIIGGIIGWLASKIMRTDAEQGLLLNIIIGVIGSLLGRWLFGSVLGLGGAVAAGTLSLAGIFWGIIGAVVLIGILKLLKIL